MTHSRKNSGEARILSLHTDEQSLILGDLINVRNRLEEDNSELREKLYEAELTINLLKYKLAKAKRAIKAGSNGKIENLSSTDDDHPTRFWSPIEKATQKFKRFTSRPRKKDSFTNTIVPGSKIYFVTPTSATVSSVDDSIQVRESVDGEECYSDEISKADTVQIRNSTVRRLEHGKEQSVDKKKNLSPRVTSQRKVSAQ